MVLDAVGAAVAFDLDLLLADLAAHLLLLGDGVLVEADALLGHDALVDGRLLLVEDDLVLLLGELGAGERAVHVGVRDRLALDPDLLTLHRHGRALLLADDVLAQAGATGPPAGGGRPQTPPP